MSELFHSPIGLYPFQQESVDRDFEKIANGGGFLAIWDPGCGKSILGMRLSTMLAEADVDYDMTIVLCERGKVIEWTDDFQSFTKQRTVRYYGSNRKKILDEQGLPDVLVTTYETAKRDLVSMTKVRGKRPAISEGDLFSRIKGKSVLWILDESAAKLKNRGSDLYKSIYWVFNQQRKLNPQGFRAVGLTGTPIEKGYEDAFNQARIVAPDSMPKIGEFEDWFVTSRHPQYGTAYYNGKTIRAFAELFDTIMDRRRKSDPDIMAQFPKKVEKITRLDMLPKHESLYKRVCSLQQGEEEPVPGLWTLMRMLAGHPASIPLAARTGQSKVAKALVEIWGEEEFLQTPSTKEAELITELTHVVKEQEQKVVIFTFFGRTILPILAQSLRDKGFIVYTNHGGMTASESEAERQKFKQSDKPCVYLTSDAGCRGINLPEATYIIEYESSLTHANRTQRIDRIHRISSQSESVTCMTMVLNNTVEEGIVETMLERNAQTDLLLGDEDAGEGFMTAQERKKLFRK